MRAFVVFPATLTLLIACSGDGRRTETPAEPTAASTTDVTMTPPAPDASASPAATAEASAAPSAAPGAAPAEGGPKSDKGPFKFAAYAGPKVKRTPKTAKVWAPVPVGLGDEWNLLKIVLIDVARTEGDTVVLKDWRGIEMFVPGALVHDAPDTQGLKKGDVVLTDVAAASAPGRVVKVEKQGDETMVTFKYNWVSPSEDTLSSKQVVKLTDKLTVGQIVAFKNENGNWDDGVFAGGDASKSFLIHGSGTYLVDTKALKPLTLTKIFKKGDKVWAGYDLKPATVVAALNEATQYKLKYDGSTKEEVVDFDDVTAPLE